MATFTLTINTDNAAFGEDEPGLEIARLLREYADGVEVGDRAGEIQDVNGNTVGRFELSED